MFFIPIFFCKNYEREFKQQIVVSVLSDRTCILLIESQSVPRPGYHCLSVCYNSGQYHSFKTEYLSKTNVMALCFKKKYILIKYLFLV